jgi:hypothetical protein
MFANKPTPLLCDSKMLPRSLKWQSKKLTEKLNGEKLWPRTLEMLQVLLAQAPQSDELIFQEQNRKNGKQFTAEFIPKRTIKTL